MTIQILDSFLREFLQTQATPEKIAECLSLCGPTVESLEKKGKDAIYTFEITTNRVDLMSVYGIAREAAAILPQFGVKAELYPLKVTAPKRISSLPFKIVNNQNLVSRAMGVVIADIANWKTPPLIKERLEASGLRSLNSVVDITNYVMLEVGHPTHAFDYDRIKNKKFVVRESTKGEKITTFDNQELKLHGGDIVFDDGEGEIIDLPGIIGTKNSVVCEGETKRVFFFVDSNDPTRIRKTSLSLGLRTFAAVINEKGPDPELAEIALLRGISLFEQITKGGVASQIYGVHKGRRKPQSISLTKEFIDQRLGTNIPKQKIKEGLLALGFEASWAKELLQVSVPSFREKDVNLPEDIIEEIARIYGYHNLPSVLMEGEIPQAPLTPFDFEISLKRLLKGFGGVEVYTLSLVPEGFIEGEASQRALKLKNPLGQDTLFLRNNLRNSLLDAAEENKGESQAFFLFEMANTYLPREAKLPEERMTLAGIFSGSFRRSKGLVEALFDDLNINYQEIPKDANGFAASKRIELVNRGIPLGEFGTLESGYHFFSAGVETLKKAKRPATYLPMPKYPPQIEDLTVVFPERTVLVNVINKIKAVDSRVREVKLIDTFKDAFTFRLWYQAEEKTLSDTEVTKIRTRVVNLLKRNGATVK